ncbi:hypothetical protein AB1Y20_016976 [Prymnesium parvum]|uniref:HNH domain-containing protein n=1 Tax=Prymnesium parvum TaxID=97485 RepID=A0AB34I9M8_PRYPA
MLWLRLLPLDAARRRRLLAEALPGLTTRRRERVVRWCHEGDLWQADHKLAVADGGGETRADDGNLQTLCVPCHQEKTAQERLGRRGGEQKKQSRKRPLEQLGLTDANPTKGELSA